LKIHTKNDNLLFFNYVDWSQMNEQARFQDTSSGVIKDIENGSEWLPKDSYGDLGKWANLQEGTNYAQLMNQVYAGGHSDWRLPSKEEVLQIYDETLAHKDWENNEIHIATVFLKGCSSYLWTSEKNEAGQSLRIDLRSGDLEFIDPCEREHQAVRLIRNNQ